MVFNTYLSCISSVVDGDAINVCPKIAIVGHLNSKFTFKSSSLISQNFDNNIDSACSHFTVLAFEND